MKQLSLSTSVKYTAVSLLLIFSSFCMAQVDKENEKPWPPKLQYNRAYENYDYLKEKDSSPYRNVYGNYLKYLSLNKSKSIYLNFGAQYRPRLEHFSNIEWTEEDQTFYSQRLDVFASINFGKQVRFFGELIHGYTSNEKQITESDDLDLHQGFLEVKFPIRKIGKGVFRFGRQEIQLGSSRLISIREGPNIKRSFDLAYLSFQFNKIALRGFYGKAVSPKFNAFDNSFELFNSNAINPQVWVADLKFPIKNLNGTNEIYYIGFQSKRSSFNDVSGKEIRHSIGIRRFGLLGRRFSYNTELVYQFGDIANNTISAYNIEADWKYAFINLKWTPKIGLKLDWSSGDKSSGDDKIQTFNPLFVNPGIYSLAAVNTPANLIAVHPNVTIYPLEGCSIYMDCSLLYRTEKNDGLYAPPRFQVRQANGIDEKRIGNVLGINLKYEISYNLEFELKSSYFIAGDFIKRSGPANNTFYISPTLSFKI